MQAPTSVDLAQTRAAFAAWRATQSGRRRIPEHLWQMAIALLDEHSISRVSHELRLNTKQLRQRKLTAAQPPRPDSANRHHFLPLSGADLSLGPAAPHSQTDSRHLAAETGLRLICERRDGSRLVLCVPPSHWDHIEALCAAWMRSS